SSNNALPAVGGIFGGAKKNAFGTAPLTVNAWSHLAATYDGAMLRLYVNGTQVASVARTGFIKTSINPLQIGGDKFFGQPFAGVIDEVRVYSVALIAAQVQADATTPVGGTVPAIPDQIGRAHV